MRLMMIHAKPCSMHTPKKDVTLTTYYRMFDPASRVTSIKSPATELDSESDGELGELEEGTRIRRKCRYGRDHTNGDEPESPYL